MCVCVCVCAHVYVCVCVCVWKHLQMIFSLRCRKNSVYYNIQNNESNKKYPHPQPTLTHITAAQHFAIQCSFFCLRCLCLGHFDIAPFSVMSTSMSQSVNFDCFLQVHVSVFPSLISQERLPSKHKLFSIDHLWIEYDSCSRLHHSSQAAVYN